MGEIYQRGVKPLGNEPVRLALKGRNTHTTSLIHIFYNSRLQTLFVKNNPQKALLIHIVVINSPSNYTLPWFS